MNATRLYLLLLIVLLPALALIPACKDAEIYDDDTYGEDDDVGDDDVVDDDTGDDDTSPGKPYIPPQRGWRVHIKRQLDAANNDQRPQRGWRLRVRNRDK